MTQWRIRIQGKRREQANIELLIQAVLILGRQLAEEQRQAEAQAEQPPDIENQEAAS